MKARPARCYIEFCCNVATHYVVIVDRSGRKDQSPIPWGWCGQHVHHAAPWDRV